MRIPGSAGHNGTLGVLIRLGQRLAFACQAWLLACISLHAQDLPRFREHTITNELKFGYQLVAADLNGDGKEDLIAIDEAATQLVWFENQHPAWKRHILAVDVPRQLNADCWDVDGDGVPEVVLAYRFEPSPERSVGNIVLFHSGADVRQPWTAREIDRVPTAHRVRWIDPEGHGKKVLLVAPVVGRRYPPGFDDPVPIYVYRPSQWKRETLSSQPQGVLHAISPVNWDGGPRQQLLTASYLGLHRFEWTGSQWVATQIAKGDPSPCPRCGSGEVRLGHIGKNRFLAAIEPWHGNQVVVYVAEQQPWKRVVIEDKMDNGHALAVGDLDGDGRDEIVCGFRGKGCKLWMFQATDARGERWKKTVLDDGGIAAADCVIEDFTGNGKPDVVAIGAATHNLKLYENAGTPFRLNRVIAFYGAPKDIASANFVLSGDWKYWKSRGGIASRGITHQQFLRKSVDEASNVLVNLDVEGNPNPVITIDEFGWDYDGGIDRHSAAILKAVHEKKPGLKIAVWQMRGPVAPGLAAIYRDTVELVMMETYFDLKDAWMIPFQLQTARLNGLLGKTIIGLGIGKESPDLGGHRWTQTKEELDQQLRLIRLIAPESPGVAFFGLDRLGKCPLTKEELDRLCGQFLQIPTDGTGLKPELLKLGRTFTRHYAKPAIFCSSEFVLPYFHSGHDGGPWGSAHQPPVARVLTMNLGDKDARGIKFGLRSPGEGGGVWAEGSVDIPARSVVVGVLPILPGKKWHGWTGTEIMEVDAPGCEVFNFMDSRYTAK